ncbi:hypothetical protein CRP01_30815 [Flavilitoribacter nigricans DSM 23189 = NBRC 102662]|uniref:Uncharacterized protein n=1 Tax=Flavilitoribacter nigricans (strain ATCC 23147 / DSM 23189 / NBRC 102662 / NCIMB 1420 / SS-2) TaxID=1122177 RepID=A0A2D0N2V0_FLAN2|nr:hypothetical protein CRP01_30815 [Flavilitoribacter nigricans DSM 23189 = NBRC 102662]
MPYHWQQAFGSIQFAIILGLPILAHNGLTGNREDLFVIIMSHDCGQSLVVISRFGNIPLFVAMYLGQAMFASATGAAIVLRTIKQYTLVTVQNTIFLHNPMFSKFLQGTLKLLKICDGSMPSMASRIAESEGRDLN